MKKTIKFVTQMFCKDLKIGFFNISKEKNEEIKDSMVFLDGRIYNKDTYIVIFAPIK